MVLLKTHLAFSEFMKVLYVTIVQIRTLHREYGLKASVDKTLIFYIRSDADRIAEGMQE
jgi:hypothetical protein